MQSMVPQYLEASLEAFQRNQTQFRDALAGAFTGGPLADIARRNMELFQTAAGGAVTAVPGGGAGAKPAAPEAEGADEIRRLRAELAALQAKVDKLAK
jgi:polyhydroxyalkanoate synthesis regulator protein